MQKDLDEQQKVLLLFLGAGDRSELDPIRIMKGLFLVAKETPEKWLPNEARYEFTAYDYGPVSFAIYSDLERLEWSGCVRARERLGRSWKYYSLTSEGQSLVSQLSKDMHPRAIEYIEALRAFVTRLGFRQLLDAVYKRYPAYAAKSVFKRSAG